MYLFNTKVLDKDYTTLCVPVDLKPIKEFNLDDSFYGGRVQFIGKAKDSPIMLLINNKIDGLQVVDVAVNKLEDLDCMVLKTYAKNRGLKFEWKTATKDDIIELLESKLPKVA